ncbi:hypothetical protein AC629_17485 [Bradyrhizobium sp. NAS80.1]|uniref:hypothetical protein n=1 Tax=Bradyrhizobium sp. NAS80.1 TaxID=1680159 RepID=UPI00095A4503|nr:hypothetical protein [Bradyrhizobium sp. NAS80.1]OKO86012.1 hypothetical protein AC629_17485 [Bradyrhizobium sp. NAS80.1]
MHASTAYFVGAGTIVAGNIMNPIAPKQGTDTSRIEWRTDAAAPSERVQYLTGSQAFGAMIAAPAQAQGEARPGTQTTQASAESPAPQPSQAAVVEPPKEQFKPAPASPLQAATPAEQQASTEPVSSPDNAIARAKDSDVKRAASERRRAERRERWAERHRYDSREQHWMRDGTDWDDVGRNIREDSDSRYVASRPRGGFPRMMLFGSDNN